VTFLGVGVRARGCRLGWDNYRLGRMYGVDLLPVSFLWWSDNRIMPGTYVQICYFSFYSYQAACRVCR
jgi:hypothetical protein